MSAGDASGARREWTLAAENELRFEASESDTFVIQLVEGSAEVFGMELAHNKEYSFTDENIAVFTWYGCRIVEVSGNCKVSYVSSDTPMVALVNTHALLEAKRDVALANVEKGPRVMIAGPPDSGKSTTCKILSSYAVRLDRTPVYVDLDVGKGSLCVPGAISACCLDQSFLNVKDDFSTVMPLAYFYGHNSPKSNPQLYQSLVSLMASKIEERMGNDSDVNASGMIIDTYAWSDIGDMETILHCAKAFSIDVILVTDDRLYSSLKPLLENSTVIVVKIPRSGGVVAQDAATRRRRRKAKIDEYFYGKKVEPGKPTTLSPARVNIRLSHYSFVQLGGLQLHEGIKAHGTNTAVDPLQGILLTPSRDNLLQCVVAVLHKEDTSDDTADGASEVKIKYGTGVVAGFLYMVEVDIEKDSAVILAPCPGPLPSKNIVVGSVKWYE